MFCLTCSWLGNVYRKAIWQSSWNERKSRPKMYLSEQYYIILVKGLINTGIVLRWHRPRYPNFFKISKLLEFSALTTTQIPVILPWQSRNMNLLTLYVCPVLPTSSWSALTLNELSTLSTCTWFISFIAWQILEYIWSSTVYLFQNLKDCTCGLSRESGFCGDDSLTSSW